MTWGRVPGQDTEVRITPGSNQRSCVPAHSFPWVDMTQQVSIWVSTGMSQSHPGGISTCPPTQDVGVGLNTPSPHIAELHPPALHGLWGPVQVLLPNPQLHPTSRFCSISSYRLSSCHTRSCNRMLASWCLRLHSQYSASLTTLLARHKVLRVSSAKRYRDETSWFPCLDRDDSVSPWSELETHQGLRVFSGHWLSPHPLSSPVMQPARAESQGWI